MHDLTLDQTTPQFKEMLDQSVAMIINRYEDLENAKILPQTSAQIIGEWFNEDLPATGKDNASLLAFVEEKVMKNSLLNIGPHMFAYVSTSGTQISVAAEMIAAALCQNVGKWHLAPVMSEIEKRVIAWAAEFIGFPASSGGIFTSGGSAANLTGLTVARNVFFRKHNIREKGLFNMKPFVVYASAAVHFCIDKSVEELGIGTDQLRKIPVHPDQRIDIDALESEIKKDLENNFIPFCIVGNAGTVATGTIDPLNALAAIAKKYELWFHIDGAFGGLAASLPSLKHHYVGLEKANSIAIDFHKWLYQPYEAGCTLINNWNDLHESFVSKANYLSVDDPSDQRINFNEYGFQLSRSAKAFKVWMTFKTYGSEKIKSVIQKDIDNTKYLAERITQLTDFELCSEPLLSAVCFRYTGNLDKTNPARIDELNTKCLKALEKDGRVFIAGIIYNGRPVMRACIINHRIQKRHVDHLLEVIKDVAQPFLYGDR